MHILFPHCNATSLGFTEYKYKQGIVELSQLNTTKLILHLSNILFPDLALWQEKAKQLQIQEKVHDHQICFKRENQRQRLQGPSNGWVISNTKQTKKQNPIYFFQQKYSEKLKLRKSSGQAWAHLRCCLPPALSLTQTRVCCSESSSISPVQDRNQNDKMKEQIFWEKTNQYKTKWHTL